MLAADAQAPATSGVGILIHHEVKHPQEVKSKVEDAHIAKAFEGLKAPQQPEESSQAYEQHCTATQHIHAHILQLCRY